ncbi:hypothetical protein [Rhodocaloribacter sp.]
MFSDEDWDRLVVDLRETFQAPGEVLRDGSLRQWRNGNLHVLVEPAESGHRLRFRTLSETLKGGLIGGLLFLVMGLFLMLLVVAKGKFLVDMGKTMLVAMFALAGLGGMGVTAYRLPRWRAERERQMEAIAARAVERAEAQVARADGELHPLPRLDLDHTIGEAEDPEQLRMRRRTVS